MASPLSATHLRIELLEAEVAYWRQEAAASLETSLGLIRAAERHKDEARVAELVVGRLAPVMTALAQALAGRPWHQLCESCSRPICDGDAVYGYEDAGEAHVRCEKPRLADPLPAHAYRHVEDLTPERIAAIVAAAQEYMGAR